MLSQTNKLFFFKLENVWNFRIAYASSRNQNFGNWRFILLPAACDSAFALEIGLVLSMITKVIKKKSFLLKEAICVGHTATLNLDQVSVETQEVCLYLIKLQKGRERNVK